MTHDPNIAAPPLAISVGGTVIGRAERLAVDADGVILLEGLDGMARVFFAERMGPGGEPEPLADVMIVDQRGGRGVRARHAVVRQFSSGTGHISLETDTLKG
jgi:hypothetical protein